MASETINSTSKWHNRVHFILVAFVAITLLSLLSFGNWTVNVYSKAPLHAALEAFGASVSIGLAIILVFRGSWYARGKDIWLGIGFLCIGVFNGFHAAIPAGDGFILLHTFSSLFGACCFSFLWLPEERVPFWNINPVRILIAAFTLCFGLSLLVIFFPRLFPPMTLQGDFTVIAITANLVAGTLFLATAVRMYLDYRQSRSWQDFMLYMAVLLFAITQLMFAESYLWNYAWWSWHFVMTLAFVILAGFIGSETFRLIRDQHHTLQKMVDQRTLELTDARKKAEKANVAKSAFLANMSHEIRTPLNAINGLIQLFQSEDLTPQQLSYLHKMKNSSDHLLSTINDILDLSKIEESKMLLEETDFELHELLQDVCLVFQDQLEARGVTLETHIEDVPERLHADVTRLRQILINYLGNAAKFTDRGAISIHARKVAGSENPMAIRFEVRDTGIGIDAGKLESLFEPFEQADTSSTRNHGGTGLGLTIAKRFARLMGGEVGVESELGKGSLFWFTALVRPAQRDKLEAEKVEVIGPETFSEKHQGARILLVEDNLINAEVARTLLEARGLNVDGAENGIVALEKVRESDYDLILMDVQMPGMDGLEATRIIRSMGQGKSAIPILALTANVFEEDRRACLDAGMNDFVSKPIDLNETLVKLNNWLPNGGPG